MNNYSEQIEAWALGCIGAGKGMYEEFVKPNPGVVAWGALGAYVVGYEILCPPGHTLSEVADRALEHSPLSKAATLVSIGMVSLHLANIIPEKWDVLHKITMFGKN